MPNVIDRFRTVLTAAVVVSALAVTACGSTDSSQLSSTTFTTARPTVAQAAREFFDIRRAPVQPIAFPHKRHIEKGLMCTDYCHESATKGPVAGLPSVKTCMICHDAIATDRPLVQQVASYQKSGLDIPWERVYGYTHAAHVGFNYAPHLRASAGCGLTVRVMEADAEVVRNGRHGIMRIAAAKKLEGQPDHPINRGGLCPRGQAAIQITYHPDRLTQPWKRTGARFTGEMKPVSWDEAIGELTARLDALADAREQPRLAILTRGGRSRRLELFDEFAKRFGAPAPLAVELFGDQVLRRANAVSFGREQLPTFDLARSRYVIGFGADFLGTWNSPVAQNFGYGEMRQRHPQIRGTFVQVEQRMSQTGACADEWIPVPPGTEGVLALGLARVIIENKLRPADAGGRAGQAIEGWAGGLTQFTAERVQRITGVPASRLDRVARAFADLRPAVAVAGGVALAHTNGLFTALAVNALNALAGSAGVEGGLNFMPQAGGAPGARPIAGGESFDTLAEAKVLLLDGANPIFASPQAWRVREKLQQVGFVCSFASFLDDTSTLADLILPDHSFLESWTDSLPESGAGVAVVNAAGPAMRPLHQTRATPEVIIELAGKLKQPVALPWKSFDEMLKASMPEAAWTALQKQGWATVGNGAGDGLQAVPRR